MFLRRALLSLALIFSCCWCLGLVRQVQSAGEDIHSVNQQSAASDGQQNIMR